MGSIEDQREHEIERSRISQMSNVLNFGAEMPRKPASEIAERTLFVQELFHSLLDCLSLRLSLNQLTLVLIF